MKKLIDSVSARVSAAFEAAGYDPAYGQAAVSNRPDLCEYQCNGALAAAKIYHKAPLAIANEPWPRSSDAAIFTRADAVAPGFLNLRLSPDYTADYLRDHGRGPALLGLEPDPSPAPSSSTTADPTWPSRCTSATSAPPSSARAIKRIYRHLGNKVIGDVHWATGACRWASSSRSCRPRRPELPYFDPDSPTTIPEEPPFTISDLEEIYPTASARSKEDADFARRAHEATCAAAARRARLPRPLQAHHECLRGGPQEELRAAGRLLRPLVRRERRGALHPADDGSLKRRGLLPSRARVRWSSTSRAATDTKEVPPCILLKSDGATLYATTDLATLVQREQDFHPDKLLYVADKRQASTLSRSSAPPRRAGLVRAGDPSCSSWASAP